IGTAFPHPLKVRLTDDRGDLVTGVPVTFTAPASGASAVFSSATALTDAGGIATMTASANNTAGTYTVVASIGTLSVPFTLTNIQPTTLTLTSSANPATFGVPLALTAAVANATPTGRVAFYDGGRILGVKPVSAGGASLGGVLLPAGSHNLTAYYRDDVNVVEGTGSLPQTVKAVAGGAFIAQTPQALPVQPAMAAVGDFDGDGKTDFAFAAMVADPNPWWQVDL